MVTCFYFLFVSFFATTKFAISRIALYYEDGTSQIPADGSVRIGIILGDLHLGKQIPINKINYSKT